jgi:signal transduction histidine kinase
MNTPAKSIKRHLILTVVLSQLLLAAGLVFTGVFYTQRRLEAALDTDLEARAMSVAALVRYAEDGSHSLVFEKSLVPPPLDTVHPDFYQIQKGSLELTRSGHWPSNLTFNNTGLKAYRSLTISGIPYRALFLRQIPILDREEAPPSSADTLTVVYATPTVALHNQVLAAGAYIAVASLIWLGLTVLLALWGIRRGLLPLKHLAAEAAQVSAQNWELRAPPDAEQVAELRPLTEAMETMLNRLRQSFMQQREFLANAAHELKTPAAILKSTLQSLLQKPRTAPEYEAGLAQALDDMERLEKLLHWMLRLARAEQWTQAALPRELEGIDIAGTCEEAISGLRSLARSRKVELHLTTNSNVVCRADPEDLELVWVNLLENAIRYSPPGATVEIQVSRDNGSGTVVVEDHGPGIPEKDLPHIFERFRRADPSRTRETGGFGLGLAIAKALVEAYGGTITPESTLGRGTRMTVTLPTQQN